MEHRGFRCLEAFCIPACTGMTSVQAPSRQRTRHARESGHPEVPLECWKLRQNGFISSYPIFWFPPESSRESASEKVSHGAPPRHWLCQCQPLLNRGGEHIQIHFEFRFSRQTQIRWSPTAPGQSEPKHPAVAAPDPQIQSSQSKSVHQTL